MQLGKLFKRIKNLFRPKKTAKKRRKRSKKLQQIAAPEIQPTAKKGIHAITEFSLVQLSHHTQRAYKADLNDFLRFLAYKKMLEFWGSATPTEIAEYRQFLKDVRNLSKSSITRKIAVVKSFYKWAQAQGWVDRNPAELIRGYPQTQDSKTGFLNDKEIAKLLNYYPDLRALGMNSALGKVCVETLLMLGLRRSEAVAIRMEHLEYTDSRWILQVQGKGNRTRRLPLPGRLCVTWAQWLIRINEEAPFHNSLEDNPKAWLDWAHRHYDQPLLVSTRASNFKQALSDSELARIIRKSGLKAGIINRISPHMLRATAITHALDHGASHRGVQQMAGWTSPLMITRYDKRRNDPKHSAVNHLEYAKKEQVAENREQKHGTSDLQSD